MKKHSIKQVMGICIGIFFLLLNYSPGMQVLRGLPSELKLFEGDVKTLEFNLPLSINIESNEIDVLKFNGNSLEDKRMYNIYGPISIESVKRGDVLLNLKLFGFIPIKELKVSVEPQKKIIPGGDSIGVNIYTKGALIVGISEIIDEYGAKQCPAIDVGLRPGDIIEKINGIVVKNANHLSMLIEKLGHKELELEIKRGNIILKKNIKPIINSEDGKLRLGIWVRDSTCGVGTLTFINPENNMFAALGHAITDVDTGTLLSVKDGEIVQAKIIDIIEGRKGQPGEIRGFFSEDQRKIGSIKKNTPYGLFGKLYENTWEFNQREILPICRQSDVKLGEAKILSTIDSGQIKEYKIDIIKINRQNYPNPKGMIIEITDPDLLQQTGGIIQGMSGSPIIQDNKIIGAVTHVFVNDPKKGYGVFIEWMLEEMEKIVEIE
ncbi:MAG TPA: SpoIVB peptidase [Clostridiales bacterium]|nr:SpoIVB peptidase [Clostridiales bacterium]